MRLVFYGATCLILGTAVLGACSDDDGIGGNASPAGGDTTSDGGGTTSSTSGGTTTPGTPASAIVTTTTESMTVNGKSRVYILKVPTSLDKSKTYPLVMDLHGSPGDAVGQSGDSFETATGQDAIIVYPQALAEDSGAFSWDLSSLAADNEDIAFLEALPNELKTTKGLSLGKVFGYGYSGGAFFLQVYQCLGAKAFRAIAASAGGAPQSLGTDQGGPIGAKTANGCVACPGTPVPALIAFGQLDESQGGDYEALCQAEQSGCDTQNLTQSTPAACRTYDGCPADKPVTYCSVPGLGHGNWADAVTTSWAFFKPYL